MAAAGQSLRVAYLINQYPGVSHSFNRREILALQAAGIEVLRFSQRGSDDPIADPADQAERGRTRYLLNGGALPIARAMLRSLLTRPGRFVGALANATRLSRGGDRSWPFFVINFAEATLLAQWLREGRAQHLHAHFGTNSAAVAMMASRLAGIGFGFTVHGPEELDMPGAIHLADKVHASRFTVAVSSFGRSQIYRWIDGPMRQVVEERARELGVQDRIRITGWISGERVRQEMLQARAMVLPSFAEGLPVVIMEAMALRRPVISTFVAGIPELVQSGRTGWLVPAGDVAALADAMGQSQRIGAAEWLAMGQAARERVLERHKVATEADKLVRHFAAAVRQGGMASAVTVGQSEVRQT